MSYPHARIYEINNNGINKVKYEDIESVNLLRNFLNNREGYLHHLFI